MPFGKIVGKSNHFSLSDMVVKAPAGTGGEALNNCYISKWECHPVCEKKTQSAFFSESTGMSSTNAQTWMLKEKAHCLRFGASWSQNFGGLSVAEGDKPRVYYFVFQVLSLFQKQGGNKF